MDRPLRVSTSAEKLAQPDGLQVVEGLQAELLGISAGAAMDELGDRAEPALDGHAVALGLALEAEQAVVALVGGLDVDDQRALDPLPLAAADPRTASAPDAASCSPVAAPVAAEHHRADA